MNEAVKKVLQENVWFLSTYSDEPNVVPVGFKNVEDDGTLTVGAILLETTINNIKANGRIAIAACNPTTIEAYQIKGSVELVTDGPIYDKYAKLSEDTFQGAFPTKCALIIKPEKIIVATPNGDNKKELDI